MQRRDFVGFLPALLEALVSRAVPAAESLQPAAESTVSVPPGLADASATMLAARLARGEIRAADLTQFYLDRIARLNVAGPALRAVIETNPAALTDATTLDRDHADGRMRGPLHGLPVLIKDNIETRDMPHSEAGARQIDARDGDAARMRHV